MRKTKDIFRQIAYVIAALIMCVFTFISGQGKLSAYSVRADSVGGFDNSPISEDLQDVSVLDYPKNPMGTYSLLRLTEFCYSERPFLAENFGLYVYVYNPTETVLEQTYNTVTMATTYNADGKPAAYDRFDLVYLDCTDNHRFYKFKVFDPEALTRSQEYAKAHNGERRYDISDIDLHPTETEKNKDGVARTYYFSGYAKGCSDETANDSTLSVRYEGLDTIDLEVNHTNYRMENEYKPYTYQEVNSVYFSVPERYFEIYGGLQKIKSAWYEYRTNPVFVVDNKNSEDGKECYEAFRQHLSEDIGDKLANFPYWVMWDKYRGPSGSDDPLSHIYMSVYNRLTNTVVHGTNIYSVENAASVPRMDWLLPADGIDFAGYQIPRETVVKYMEDYTAAHPSQVKLAGKYAENLFAESIEQNRVELLDNPADKRGKITQEIDAEEDTFDLMQYKDQSFWDKFLCKPPESEWVKDVSPISEIDPADVELSRAAFCKKYLVGDRDYETVIKYVSEAAKKTDSDKVRPVIFHFAINNYRASPAIFDHYNATWGDNYIIPDPNGYVARQTVFLDYKIISLTFRKNGTDTVVPVVSNPLDIINGFDPPNDDDLIGNNPDWKTIIKFVLGIIGIILLLVILAPVLPFVFQAVIWVITLPFRLIGWIFKSISNAVKKRKQ